MKTLEWENIKHMPSVVDVCKLLLLTVEFAVDLGSGLPLGKPAVPCL
jgi:hypothetical protein